jgi:hypothetical protein
MRFNGPPPSMSVTVVLVWNSFCTSCSQSRHLHGISQAMPWQERSFWLAQWQFLFPCPEFRHTRVGIQPPVINNSLANISHSKTSRRSKQGNSHTKLHQCPHSSHRPPTPHSLSFLISYAFSQHNNAIPQEQKTPQTSTHLIAAAIPENPAPITITLSGLRFSTTSSLSVNFSTFPLPPVVAEAAAIVACCPTGREQVRRVKASNV